MRLFLLIAAILLPPIGAFLYFVLLRDSSAANEVYALIKIAMFVVALLGWRLSHSLIKESFRGTKRDLLIGILSGVLVMSILILSWVLLDEFLLPYHALITTKATSLFPLNLYIPLALVFSIFHSLFEEWYWWGFVFTQLDQRLSPLFALVLGAITFTAHHVIILSQLFPGTFTFIFSAGIFLVALFWITLYRKTGNLIAPWISHLFADATIFVIGYTMI